MRLHRPYILLPIFAWLMSAGLVAQTGKGEWQAGYFAPYLSHVGGMLGLALDLKEMGTPSGQGSTKRLQLLSQLGYFTQVNVSKNILLQPDLVYKWNKQDSRFFLSAGVGAGYLLEFQRQEGTLDLASGEIDYRYKALHYFLPSLNAGLGLEPKKHFGFYLKATYGRKMAAQNAHAAFAALSAGLIFKFNSNE